MRLASKFLPVAVAIGLAAVVALAQPPAEPRDGGPKSAPGAAPDKAAVDALVARMLVFDKNKDGKLTRDEISDPRMLRAFDRADANHDGVVTKDELTAWATKEAAQDGGREGQGMGPPDGGPGGPGPGGFGGPGGPGRRRGPGGRGFGGFGTRTKPGQVLSPGLMDTLKLTDEQKKQAAELQKHVDEQLGTILTAKQKQRLKDLQSGGGGPGGFGGPGGPGGFGPGGPGGFGPGRRGRGGSGGPPNGGPGNGGPPGDGPPDRSRGGQAGPGGQDSARDRGPGGPPPDGGGPPNGDRPSGERRDPDGPPGDRTDRSRDRGPGGFGGPGGGFGRGGGPGGFGGGGGPLGQIFSPTVVDELNLRSAQKKQLGTLQKEVDGKIALLLTDHQKQQFKEMSQRTGGRRGGPGFGGPMDGPPGRGPAGDGPPERGPGQPAVGARDTNGAGGPPAGEHVASIGRADVAALGHLRELAAVARAGLRRHQPRNEPADDLERVVERRLEARDARHGRFDARRLG